MFAITPGNLLNEHRIASATINPAHRVQQKDEETPERNNLEAPLGEMIVAGTRLVAARTNSRRTRAGTHRDLNRLFVRTEAGMLVNETRKMMAAV